jgi:ankyrin repeat protein
MTPLMGAAINDHADVVAVLLEKGADGSIRNESGQTALDLARESGAAEAVEQIEAARSGWSKWLGSRNP